jgi:hypothetical protein
MIDDIDRDKYLSDTSCAPLGTPRDGTTVSTWGETLSLITKAGNLLRLYLEPTERAELEEILARSFWGQSPEIPSTNCIVQLLAVAL